MKNPNKFQVALALSRRLDRLDPVSAAEAEKIIAAVEAGESINAPLKAFFASAWERLGRAAAGAGNPRETKAALAHLQALAEVSDALGFGPAIEAVSVANEAETDTETVTETASFATQNWS